MPDITMCGGDGCPVRATCYRHTATPTPGRQVYFTIVPLFGPGGCGFYLPTTGADEGGESDEG